MPLGSLLDSSDPQLSPCKLPSSCFPDGPVTTGCDTPQAGTSRGCSCSDSHGCQLSLWAKNSRGQRASLGKFISMESTVQMRGGSGLDSPSSTLTQKPERKAGMRRELAARTGNVCHPSKYRALGSILSLSMGERKASVLGFSRETNRAIHMETCVSL